MQNPSVSPAEMATENKASVIMLIMGFFLFGWLVGQLSNSMQYGLLETAKLAFTNQYHASAGYSGDPRTYYVVSSNVSALQKTLEGDSDVEQIEPTILDNILIVKVRGDSSSVFNRIRNHQYVKTITSIPLFCH